MTERLYVRQITDNHWQWRMQFADGSWDDDIHAGTIELLAEWIPHGHVPVCVVMSGAQAVVRKVALEGVDRKLLAKLMPYEMEDDIIDSVDDLHFCFGAVADDHVDVLYTRNEVMEAALEEVEMVSSEVHHVLPDFMLLDLSGAAAALVLDGETVIAKFGSTIGFAVEINIAPMIIESLSAALDLKESAIYLVADSTDGQELLKTCLPEAWQQDESVELLCQEGCFWDYIDTQALAGPVNLRTGAFALRLPIDRWWRTWKTPAYALAAGFVLALVANFAAYLQAKSEGKEIRQQIEQVYLSAVPNGRRGDEENRLQSLLRGKGGGSASQPTNLVTILGGLSQAIDTQKDIQLSNFRYSGDQQELQVNIEVKGLSELGRFREELASSGVESDSPRTSRQGEAYQASIKLSEKN